VSAAIRSELLKLRSTRTFLGLVLAAAALVALIAGASAGASEWGPQERPGADLLSTGALAQIFALVLGVLAVSTELRHGTITPSLLAVPRRTRLVLAKVASHFAAGVVLGIAAFALAAAVGLGVLALRDIPSELDTARVLELVVGGTIGTGLFAAIGVGVGTLIRSQVAAIVAVFAWLLVVEPLLTVAPALRDPIETYGIGGAGDAVSSSALEGTPELGQVAGALLLVGYAAALAAAGIAALRRRDVTG
jgi:ABC-2 type transport system permease protein